MCLIPPCGIVSLSAIYPFRVTQTRCTRTLPHRTEKTDPGTPRTMMRLVDLLNPSARAKESQLAHALRAVPLFKELPADDLVRIWRALAELRVPAGAVVCHRGDPGDRFYVVQSGSLEVRLGLGPEGIGIRRLVPGHSFGEMALLTGAPRSADVVAAEDSVLWVLEQQDFQQITATSIPLLQAINKDLCTRIDDLTNTVSDLESRLGTRQSPGVAGMRFGPYRVVEQIGAGGMAVVYSATHVETEEAAALKVLPSAWGEATEFRARLQREADALQRLDHPNVVRVFHVGEVDATAGGGCFLAMEWLPHALDRVLLARYPEPLPIHNALDLAARVARALGAAHDAGFIHRDVKPANILLRADGAPVLTDFGLVLLRSDAAAGRRLTAENVIVGTADYMSPEQIVGGPIDGRSDLYSLGVVLYEMLAGHTPFAGRDPYDVLNAHVEQPPPPLPDDVPTAARDVVHRALEKDPSERFHNAALMADALTAALSDTGAQRAAYA